MIRLVSLSRNLGKICLGFMFGVSMTACVDKSLYETSIDPNDYMPGEAPNSFDFSTVLITCQGKPLTLLIFQPFRK